MLFRSRRATVFCAAASEPASGSDSAKQPSILPVASGARKSRFCSSVPNFTSGSQTSELLTDRMTPDVAQTRLISSMMRQ